MDYQQFFIWMSIAAAIAISSMQTPATFNSELIFEETTIENTSCRYKIKDTYAYLIDICGKYQLNTKYIFQGTPKESPYGP
jgi:hypothetical protein